MIRTLPIGGLHEGPRIFGSFTCLRSLMHRAVLGIWDHNGGPLLHIATIGISDHKLACYQGS